MTGQLLYVAIANHCRSVKPIWIWISSEFWRVYLVSNNICLDKLCIIWGRSEGMSCPLQMIERTPPKVMPINNAKIRIERYLWSYRDHIPWELCKTEKKSPMWVVSAISRLPCDGPIFVLYGNANAINSNPTHQSLHYYTV